jgi:hypothetical protein
MGFGLSGSSLAGGFVVASAIIPPAGLPAVLASSLGKGASDIVTKIGSLQADADVVAGARLSTIRTGVNGTEVEYFSFQKNLLGIWGNASMLKFDNNTGNVWNVGANISALTFTIGVNATVYTYWRGADGFVSAPFGLEANTTPVTPAAATWRAVAATGLVFQDGTDSSATPGNATISQPSGISAIANGTATITITNTLIPAVATRRVRITTGFMSDPGALVSRVWCVQNAGGGSFTINTNANVGSDTIVQWNVDELL